MPGADIGKTTGGTAGPTPANPCGSSATPPGPCNSPVCQQLDGIPFRLRAPFDFGFLSRWGRVFQVFDDQDSGNICFGIQNGGQKLFVKFAGAPALRYDGSPAAAVERLKCAQPLYHDLRHPALIRLVDAQEAGGGFALLFRWQDGDCMGRQYPAAHARFMQLPVTERLQVYAVLLDFLAEAHARGYVAVDLYDGSLLYDFAAHKAVVCDVDLFQKRPYVNTMGRMWGSGRFMSPEEYTLGAPIDEVTNVYTAGAFAFALFAEYDRSEAAWTLPAAAWQVAARAVSEDRTLRQQNIRQLQEEWEQVLADAAGGTGTLPGRL